MISVVIIYANCQIAQRNQPILRYYYRHRPNILNHLDYNKCPPISRHANIQTRIGVTPNKESPNPSITSRDSYYLACSYALNTLKLLMMFCDQFTDLCVTASCDHLTSIWNQGFTSLIDDMLHNHQNNCQTKQQGQSFYMPCFYSFQTMPTIISFLTNYNYAFILSNLAWKKYIYRYSYY